MVATRSVGTSCSSETTSVAAMHVSHPVFGELVTSNRLVRGSRWVFRGTIVLLDDVFADLCSGLTLHEVWEKHGALERHDLEAVVLRALATDEFLGVSRPRTKLRVV